jgi:hypothetical protein
MKDTTISERLCLPNQALLFMYQDIQTLFELQPSRSGWSAPPMDFRSSTSFDKRHGRLERQRITVSSLLASYSEWPGLSQVFKLERTRTNAQQSSCQTRSHTWVGQHVGP